MKTSELAINSIEPETGRVWATVTVREMEAGQPDVTSILGPRAFEPDDDIEGIMDALSLTLERDLGSEPISGPDRQRIRDNCAVVHTPELVAAVQAAKAARRAEEEARRQAEAEAAAAALARANGEARAARERETKKEEAAAMIASGKTDDALKLLMELIE